MRQLYLQFQKVAPPGQLSWTYYKYILPIKEETKRNYYINLSIKQNLSKKPVNRKNKK